MVKQVSWLNLVMQQRCDKASEKLIDDPSLLRRMGKAAKERLKEFQASAIVTRIENIYHEELNT